MQDINKAERLMSTEDDESEELTAIFECISRRENEITALDSSIVNLLESEDEIARDVEETLMLQDKLSVIKTRITKYIQNKNPPVRSNQHASHAPSMSKKHSSNRCKSKGRCLKCQRKHHTSICKDGE